MADRFLPTSKTAEPTPPGAAMDRRIAAPSRFRRWRWAAAGLFVIIVAIALLRLVPAPGTLSVTADEIMQAPATNGVFQDVLPMRGTVTPLRTVYLDAVEAGQVQSVAVLDGAQVSSGQVLANLSSPQLELEVSAREAEITGQLGSASAQRLTLQQSLTAESTAIAQADYDALKAQRDLSVRRALQAQGFESDAAVKNSADETNYDGAHVALLRTAYQRDTALAQTQLADIADTEARLRRNLDQVQSSLQALIIRAPFTGRLANFTIEPGQSVKEGDRVGQIDSADAFRLDADVDEFYLGRVAAGQSATASFDSGNATLAVSNVLPQVSNGQFHVELTFTGPVPAGLQSGQTADMRVTLGANRTALLLPNGPWFPAGGGHSIFVLDPDGHAATRRAITTGQSNQDQVEITSGLAAGERVVTSDTSRFQNYSRLRIQ